MLAVHEGIGLKRARASKGPKCAERSTVVTSPADDDDHIENTDCCDIEMNDDNDDDDGSYNWSRYACTLNSRDCLCKHCEYNFSLLPEECLCVIDIPRIMYFGSVLAT